MLALVHHSLSAYIKTFLKTYKFMLMRVGLAVASMRASGKKCSEKKRKNVPKVITQKHVTQPCSIQECFNWYLCWHAVHFLTHTHTHLYVEALKHTHWSTVSVGWYPSAAGPEENIVGRAFPLAAAAARSSHKQTHRQ